MTPQELYVELKKAQYDSRPYDRLTGMGDNMEIVEEVIDNYWRERFLLNNTEKTTSRINGVIVGIAVAVVLVIVAVLLRRRKKQQAE